MPDRLRLQLADPLDEWLALPVWLRERDGVIDDDPLVLPLSLLLPVSEELPVPLLVRVCDVLRDTDGDLLQLTLTLRDPLPVAVADIDPDNVPLRLTLALLLALLDWLLLPLCVPLLLNENVADMLRDADDVELALADRLVLADGDWLWLADQLVLRDPDPLPVWDADTLGEVVADDVGVATGVSDGVRDCDRVLDCVALEEPLRDADIEALNDGVHEEVDDAERVRLGGDALLLTLNVNDGVVLIE